MAANSDNNNNNNANKPSTIYRASNVALDLVTMGVCTARYKHGWANAWKADGCSCIHLNADGTHKPHCTANATLRKPLLDEDRQ
jgi:hypothetical protein